MGLMSGSMDDDDDDDDDDDNDQRQRPTPRHDTQPVAVVTHPQTQIPLASPRPGYAAPISALNLSRPAPAAVPNGRQPVSPQDFPRFQMPPPSPMSVPSTPHPLQPPITPIIPVFARPSKSPAPPRDVQFASEPIMRGNSEDMLIPKRGEKGDDFWRRFSMVAHVEKTQQHKESTWLRKTQNGSTRLSRWVWFVGVCLLICIAGAIVLAWFFTHNKPSNQQPISIGGDANEPANTSVAAGISGAASSQIKGAVAPSLSPYVSPTNTVARRAANPMSTPDTFFNRELQNTETFKRHHAKRMLHH